MHRAMMFGLPLLVALSPASPLLAQDSIESAEEGEEYSNSVEILLGAATETEGGESGWAIGLGYLRHISGDLKIGVVAEVAPGLEREWLLLAPLYVQPIGGLLVGMGPGIDSRLETHGDEEERTIYLAVRFSAAWEFEVGRRFFIAPEVNMDVVDGSGTWVYGMVFGVAF